jgi:hypothetical protein
VTDVTLGIKLTGDAKGLVGEVRLSRQEIQALSRDTEEGRKAATDGRKATEDLAQAMKKMHESLGLNRAEQDKYTESLKKGSAETDKSRGAQESLTGSMFKGVGAVELVRRAWDQAVQTFHEVVDATRAAQESHARLEAGLRATNGASGQTTASIGKLADEMARLTVFDDTAIRNAAASLLTFDQITGKTFDRVIKLSADLAATGRGDLQTWITVLAKAGTEPAESIGLVERALGKLSPALKIAIQNAVDNNDKLKAQSLLYDEVASRVGGVAVESYRGLQRQLEGTRKAWDDLKRTVGDEIFSAKSKEASVFETQLRSMADNFKSRLGMMRDAWNELPEGLRNFLTGAGPAERAIFGSKQTPIQQTRDELNRAQQAYSAAQSYGDESPRLRGEVERLQALLRRQMQPNAIDPWSTEPGFAAPVSKDRITDVQKRELRAQDLAREADYLSHIYQLRAEASQRELGQLEQLHAAQIVSDEAYWARKAQLGEQGERDDIARIQSAIALAKQQLGGAGADLSRVMTGDHSPDEVKAALEKVAEIKGKIKGLTQDQVAAENKLGDAQKAAAISQYQADVAHMNRWVAIARDQEDYERGLQRQTDDMQFQLSLIGKDEVATNKANAERRLTLDLLEKRKALEREISDLQFNKPYGYQDEVERKKAEIDAITAATRKAITDQGKIIEDTFGANTFKEIGGGIADALLTGGKNGARQLKDFLIAEFKKLVLKPILEPLMSQFAAQAFKMLGITPGADRSMGILGQLGAGATIGAFGGGMGASLFGAGARGTQAGMISGAVLGAIGMAVAGPIGAVIGSVVGAVIGKFTDPHGDANRTAQFGNNPTGSYSFSATSRFGTFGTFDDKWFSDKDMGATLRAFLAGQARIENTIAAALRPGELERVQTALAGKSNEFSFGMEHTDFASMLGELTKDRLATIVEAIMPGMGKLITAAQGSGEELGKLVDALFQLRDIGKSLDEMITQISGTATQQIAATIGDLDDKVSKAREALTSAIAGNDPAAILAAEQTLSSAVMNRYNTEISMVRQLQQAIEDLKQQSYEFSLGIAQRIAGAGGSANVAGLAFARAGTIRASIGGDDNPAMQLQGIHNYVGAIDTWYEARKSAIERDVQAQAAAAQAAAQAQQAAYQQQIAAAQQQLAIAQQWSGVLDRTKQLIDQMRLTGVNPLSAAGRLDLAGGDAAIARAGYTSATGANKVTAANRYVDALQAQLGLLGDVYQRPSPEYQAIYNQIIAQLTQVQGDAKSEAERSVDLQAQIVQLQQEGNVAAQIGANAGVTANAQLDALNQEYIDQLTWAQAEGERLYNLQIQQHQEQLDTITGGQDVELFIAARQAEAVAILKDIKDLIAAWFVAQGATVTSGPGASTTAPRGGTPGGGGSSSSGGDRNVNVSLEIDGRVLGSVLVPIIDDRMDARSAYSRRLASYS